MVVVLNEMKKEFCFIYLLAIYSVYTQFSHSMWFESRFLHLIMLQVLCTTFHVEHSTKTESTERAFVASSHTMCMKWVCVSGWMDTLWTRCSHFQHCRRRRRYRCCVFSVPVSCIPKKLSLLRRYVYGGGCLLRSCLLRYCCCCCHLVVVVDGVELVVCVLLALACKRIAPFFCRRQRSVHSIFNMYAWT